MEVDIIKVITDLCSFIAALYTLTYFSYAAIEYFFPDIEIFVGAPSDPLKESRQKLYRYLYKAVIGLIVYTILNLKL